MCWRSCSANGFSRFDNRFRVSERRGHPGWASLSGTRNEPSVERHGYLAQNGRNFSAMAGGMGMGVMGPPVVESRQQTAVIFPSATSSSP